jgi:hypothetical protein
MARFEVKWRTTVVELLTIVVGVLIALAADDWRASVRDRAEARDYETRLAQALEADLDEYEWTAGHAGRDGVAGGV